MGLLATMSAFGTALGPSLGGLLLAGFGWRAIFLVHLPLGAVSLAMVYRHVGADRAEERPVAPPSNDAAGAPFDVVGTLLLALALGAYALAMTVRPASARGGFGSINLVLLALAAVGAVLFAMVEARARAPLVRLALFRDAALRASLAMSMLVATVMMATLVVGPFYLARTLGLDAAGTGLVLAAGPLAAALAGVPAGRLAERRGHHLATMAGLLGIAAGAFAVAAMPTALGIPGYVLPLVVITVGYALFQTANNTAVMTAVPTDQRGVVAGLLSLSRNLGLVTGASAMGALFAAASSAAGAVGTPQGTAVGMRITFAVAGLLALMAVGLALAGRGQGRGLQHRVAAPVSLGARDP
jgi:MFS family permease